MLPNAPLLGTPTPGASDEPSAASQGLPADPIFTVRDESAAIALLERIAGGRCDVSRAGRYTVFPPPLAIVYDPPTCVAWLCSVSVDGRLATVEATAVWSDHPCDITGCEGADTREHLLGGRRSVWLCGDHMAEVRR